MSEVRDRSIPVGAWRQIRQFRSHVPPTEPVHRDPCILCGVRGDVGCRHLEIVQ
jgi:hypothetical protein